VQLDITDDEQVAALVNVLPDTLNAVVNNAGVVVAGPVEVVPVAELRRQLEINVVGQAAVTQAVLPRLRSSRGRLVFVSSVSGLIATPMFGPYSASKFALEAMVDALRMELAPWASASRSSSPPRPTPTSGATSSRTSTRPPLVSHRPIASSTPST
jgi:NAD(P)-dependent dehydrogenase (short-subunit alcohol dehydrogenase family)